MLAAAFFAMPWPALPLLVAVLLGAAACVAWRRRTEVPGALRDREDMSSLSWAEVDRVARSLFARYGFTVSGVRRNRLAGVDLVLGRGAERIFVRLDHWKVWSVGVQPLRRLQEVTRREGADHAVVLTAGEFSPEARDFASATGIEIVDGRQLGALIERVEPGLLKLAA